MKTIKISVLFLVALVLGLSAPYCWKKSLPMRARGLSVDDVNRAAKSFKATDIPPDNQAILSLKGNQNWQPTREEARTALNAVQGFLDNPDGVTAYERGRIELIRQHITEYRVQFVGDGGAARRVIWCNFFPAAQAGHADQFSEWREKPVVVDDGGIFFWNITYDGLKGKCATFRVNFEA